MGKEMNKFKFGEEVLMADGKRGSILGTRDNKYIVGTPHKDDFMLWLPEVSELTPATNWIPCSERMPDFNVRVLVASGNRFSHDFLLNMGTHTEWASLENWEYWMLAPDMPEEKE